MILTDHDLSDLIANHDLIQNDTYDPDCVTNIGYDLRSKAFFDENGEQHTKILTPGENPSWFPPRRSFTCLIIWQLSYRDEIAGFVRDFP